MRVLIVKVSSLGDVIHILPAITDAYHAKRGLRFDWVVEEAFTEIPRWHPAIDKVIPVAFRRWRKNLFKTWRSGEFAAFKHNLQEHHYDLVIDAQGLIKSGIISRIARGLTVGLNTTTIRERSAALFYNVKYTVPWQQHAVERLRDLFSRTFNYGVDYKNCDYGLSRGRFRDPEASETPYLVLLHGTTWESKQWPMQYWKRLIRLVTHDGYRVKLLWGDEGELARAKEMAENSPQVDVLDRMGLTGIAQVMANSAGVVTVDTGLGHLAAAFSLPTVAVYGASNAELTGTYGRHQLHLPAYTACSPCLKKSCIYQGEALIDSFDGQDFVVKPPCYRDHPPEVVWEKLQELMRGGRGTLDALFYPE
ncbi:MAG: lipopolysaccharide heptosyltransferase I [Pseudomonadales bacterium]|jgi:heptosyltransferase-1|nr:lipopolysaccharide heptosyltransferase I [Pseudomonadales bacterium]